ncbi:MAG TPA: DUF2318 domain-containing protein [Geobacteraceae bacterium]|nr:DUF2318 domain-containing protein [Geobacteraceae bacterium]
MGKSERKDRINKSVGKSKKSIIKWTALTVTALLLGVGAVFAFSIPGLSKSEKVKPANGAVAIPLAKVADGNAHFYRLGDGGKDIGFFVVKGSDGALHTAFDACDVCFREKKGYVQQGDFMICKNCNKKFAINMIGRIAGGGCNPSHLNHSEDGKNVVIKVADIKPGALYF